METDSIRRRLAALAAVAFVVGGVGFGGATACNLDTSAGLTQPDSSAKQPGPAGQRSPAAAEEGMAPPGSP